MRLVVTTIAALTLSMNAAANVNETLTNNQPLPFVTEQAISTTLVENTTKNSPDAIAVKIQEIQSQTDIDVNAKINEVESLVNQMHTKDDELSNLIKELTTQQSEDKIAKQQAQKKLDRQRLTAIAAKKKIQQTKNTRTRSSRNLSRSSPPMITARKASRNAHSRSTGYCARYVRIALQAGGYRFTPNASAYMYETRGTLRKAGFTKINNRVKNQAGDVVVISRSRAHPHGHMAIFDGRNWISDFRQKRKSPYRKHYNYTTYRDSRYLGSASAKGLYMANK